jgi:lactate dehydrogenase-like 2-hydroxyacid dehydrogenase
MLIPEKQMPMLCPADHIDLQAASQKSLTVIELAGKPHAFVALCVYHAKDLWTACSALLCSVLMPGGPYWRQGIGRCNLFLADAFSSCRFAGCAVESVAEDEVMRILILLRNFLQGASREAKTCHMRLAIWSAAPEGSAHCSALQTRLRLQFLCVYCHQAMSRSRRASGTCALLPLMPMTSRTRQAIDLLCAYVF